MKLSNINPFIRFYAEFPSPVSPSGFVRAYDCRIFYIKKGDKVDFFIGGDKYSLAKGDAVYVPSGSRYRYSYKRGGEVCLNVINFDFTSDNDGIVNAMPPIREGAYDESKMIAPPSVGEFSKPLIFKDAVLLKTALVKIDKLFTSKPVLYREFSSVELKSALLSLAAINQQDAQRISDKIRKITEYISLNYAENVTLEKVGEMLGYHPYHVNRIIKKELGKTLHNYLLDVRVKEAKRLLNSTELSVVEIGASVGFENQSHFSYVFKNKEGVTPTEYRKAKAVLSQ